MASRFELDDDLQLAILATQQKLNDSIEFMRANLASRHDTESMTLDVLKNRPSNDDIRHIVTDKILSTKPFTSGHQVVFCTIRDAERALTLAFEKIHNSSHTTRLSIVMAGGIEIGREFQRDAFQDQGHDRFFKNGCEEAPGTLLWDVGVAMVPDGSGGYYKELRHGTTYGWVPYKTCGCGCGCEAHLGHHYADCLDRALEEANKVPGKPMAKYFGDIPPIDHITTWDIGGSCVNSISMAVMHLLALRIAGVEVSDDPRIAAVKIMWDGVLAGNWWAEVTDEDADTEKSLFFSMKLLLWAIDNPTKLEDKIMA